MLKGKLTRELAIEIAGLQVVELVEKENCEPTSRPDDELKLSKVEEFASMVTFIDEDDNTRTLALYYYPTYNDMADAHDHDDDLSVIDWEARLRGFEIY
jgi:hypothetical protein